MEISRRTLLRSTAAVAATGGRLGQDLAQAGPAAAASAPGDVVGKITVGYQGWFACAGDGAPINGWWHWSNNWAAAPSPSNNNIKAWPDMSEYAHVYQTAYSNLNGGAPATLFSSYDQQTVDTHFLWMQQNGCDTAALQRFNPNSSEGTTRDAMAAKVRSSAETHSPVKFFIMYDVTGWTNMQSEIKADWTNKMSAHTASSAYARQNGKPVVGIWGFGFNDANHPWDAATCLDVVDWFKSQGCYVMGGVPRECRTGTGGSRAGYSGVYHSFDMLSPWMVGAIGTIADSDSAYTDLTVPDLADCTTNGVDYQPCVLPGDVSANQRVHGDFMWEQFYNMCRAGVRSIYISMFDEYGEGNQIAKTAATQAGVPAGSGLLSLDSDGTACSSDYYLRLTADGGRMLKRQIAITATRPTQPVVGSPPPPPPPSNLALNKPTSASSSVSGYPSGSAVDGNTGTYWESANNAFPQWWQVDLGSATGIGSLSMALPSSWGARQQTVLIQGSTDGSSFSTIVAAASYTFDPSTGNSVTVTLPATTARYVRLTFSANTGWPAGQLAEVSVLAGAGSPPPPPPPSNLALNKAASASGSVSGYPSGSAVDGNTGTYWESTNNAFPQWWQVDLGSAQSFSRLVLNLPPATAWATRTQTLSVLGSNDGSSFSTVVGSAGYRFDPSTGNTVTITFGAVSYRYVRLNITGNTGWPAGQLSEVQVWAS